MREYNILITNATKPISCKTMKYINILMTNARIKYTNN